MPISELVGSDLKQWQRVRELQADGDFDDWQRASELQADGSFKEIFSTGGIFLIAQNGTVHAYDANLTRDSSKDFALGSGNWQAVFFLNNIMYMVDTPTLTRGATFRAYDGSGKRLSSSLDRTFNKSQNFGEITGVGVTDSLIIVGESYSANSSRIKVLNHNFVQQRAFTLTYNFTSVIVTNDNIFLPNSTARRMYKFDRNMNKVSGDITLPGRQTAGGFFETQNNRLWLASEPFRQPWRMDAYDSKGVRLSAVPSVFTPNDIEYEAGVFTG